VSKKQTAFVTVGVDGGAASGKSSTSERLALRYGLLHVDTGTHYRALSAGLLADGVSPHDTGEAAEYVGGVFLETEIVEGSARMLIDGKGFEAATLRGEAVNACVSRFAAMPAVRQALRQYQRNQVELARETGFAGLIMEGRDIGSVILPDADLLFFLEADACTRAQRRAAEGQQDTIAERDRIDSSRKTAPLTCPPKAERINTGEMSLDKVVAYIGKRIEAFGIHPAEEEP